MKLFLCTLGALLLISEARERIPCPVPHYHSEVTEEVCSTYQSCEWLDSNCLLRQQEDIAYVMTGNKEESSGKTSYTLNRNSDFTLFGKDVLNLVFEVYRYDDSHVRVRITDRDNPRYEVPIPLNLPELTDEPENPLYEVVLANEEEGSLFDFKVIRKSTGITLFDTSSVSGFVFEDQFLQIATALPSSYVYGMGENVHQSFIHPFDNSTYNIFAWDQTTVADYYGIDGTHPVYHCIEDDAGNSHATFFFSSNAMEYSLRDLPNHLPAIVFRTIGGIFDVHFFLGPQPEDLIQQYTSVIGFPMMPPYWGLGFQLSRYGYNTMENMQLAVNRTRDAGIPHDVQYLDIDYFDGRRDFTYSEVNFPGLPDYLRYLKTVGVRFIPILDPALAIQDDYEPFTKGREMDVFVSWPTEEDVPSDQPPEANDFVVGYEWPEPKTVFPDFFYPPTQEWWVNLTKLYHETISFDGLWIDMDQPSNFGTNLAKPDNYPEDLPPWSLKCKGNNYDEPPYPTYFITMSGSGTFSDKTLCMISEHQIADGGEIKKYRHYDVHSLYGWSEAVATNRANQEATGQRPLVISRSTYPSSGKYVGHRLGDNFATYEDMKRSITGMFEFNMFGIPYVGADICGFLGDTSEELCSRWMALGAFYPFSRNHNDISCSDQDPGLWESTIEASKKALGARYHMLPYLYTLLYSAHTAGHSVIRPLLNQFPADLVARDFDDEFLWGSHVLVVPIVTIGALSRQVYFPEAHWYNYWDRQLTIDHAGFINVPLDVTSIGVYIRAGGIIPTKKEEVNTDLQRKNPFGLIVALDSAAKASGELFWDDGVTVDSISQGNYYLSTITFEEYVLSMKVIQSMDLTEELTMGDVEILGCDYPDSVTIDGQAVPFDYESSVLIIHLQHDMRNDLTVVIDPYYEG